MLGKLSHSLILILLAFNTSYLHASSELETEALERIVAELKVVIEMVDEAQLLQRPGEMTSFQYRPLKRDLNVVIDGINTHIDEQFDTTYKRVPLFAESNGVYE